MQQAMQQTIEMKKVDDPTVREIFADSLGISMFDGHLVRIEFLVGRFDRIEPPAPPSGKQYPAARLVLTPQAATVLHQQLSGMLQLMEQQGLVKRQPIVPEPFSKQ